MLPGFPPRPFLLLVFLCIFANSFTANAQLHGVYTINSANAPSATNYISIYDATNDLMNGARAFGTAHGPGVSGKVTFNIARGSYNEGLVLGKVKGASQVNRITFQSVSSDSSKVAVKYPVILDSASFVTFRHITFNSTDTVGVNIRNAHNDSFVSSVFRQVYSYSRPEYCVKTSMGSANNVFSRNHIVNGHYGMSALNTGVHGSGLVLMNNVFDSSSYSVYLTGEDKMVIKGNSFKAGAGVLDLNQCDSNWTINANSINTSLWLYSCFSASTAPALVYNNMVAKLAMTTCSNIRYCNNSMYYAGSQYDYIIALHENNPGVNVTNNIIEALNGAFLYTIDTGSKTCIIDNNIFATNSSNFGVYGGTTISNATDWRNKTPFDAHSQLRDPRYRLTTPFDLYATNIFIQQGTPVSYITTDYYGVKRNTLHPAIGATEISPDSCMSGTYTIGGAKAVFASFAAATQKLKAWGICGKVVFLVNDGTYNEHVHLGPVFGSSASNTILFTSLSGDSSKVKIVNTANSYITFTIDSTDYVTLSRMTLSNLNNITLYKRYGRHDSISHMIILNCDNPYQSGYNHSCIKFANPNDTGSSIQNCYLHAGYVVLNADTLAPAIGSVFSNNIMDSCINSLHLFAQDGFKLSGNILKNSPSSISLYSNFPVWVDHCHNGWEISGNRIKKYFSGIYITASGSQFPTPSYITNNIINSGNGDISIDTGINNINIYYNTCTSGIGIRHQSPRAGINIENNIIANIKMYDDYPIGEFDYNVYLATQNFYYYHYYTDPGVPLQEWKRHMNEDWHSMDLNPGFDTATYIPRNYATRIGVPLPQVTKDINSKTRYLDRTTAGACELKEIAGSCLSGTYTIGGKGSDYATFNAAATDLLLRCVCGRTVFNVADGIYKESLKLRPFPGLSAENRVIFQSASGDSSKVIITDSNASGKTICFDSANYITFRKMTIASSDTFTIYIYNSNGDSISNNLVLQKSSASQYYCIYDLMGDSDVTLAGNHIIGGYYGIGTNGNNNSFLGTKIRLKILDNIFDSIINTAAVLENEYNMSANGNKIGLAHPAKCVGFNIEGVLGKSTFSKNLINTTSNYALLLTDCSYMLVSNNMIRGNAYGIQSSANVDLKYYNNNIIAQKDGIFIFQYERGAELKNNNIVMTTGNGVPLSLYDKTVLDTSDYNNYYANGNYICSIYKTGDYITDISGMQSKLGYNTNSRSEDPKYTSSDDLHIQDTALGAKGIALPGVTDDFDGKQRPYKPTIGANELNPINDFYWAFTNPCLPNASVHYSIIKTNPLIKTYKWDLGDGNGFVAGGDTISHIYSAAGAYTVQVKMYLAGGTEVGTVTHTVTIYTVRKALMVIDSVACLNSPVIFYDTAYSGSGNLNYAWNFGDGKTDSVQTPAHAYTKAGAYTVTLTVTSQQGCTSTTSKNIRISALPVLAFHVQNNACAGSVVNLNDSTALLNKGSLAYTWNFGDGTTSALYSPSHTYTKAGTDSISLTATSSLGCAATLKKPISIEALPILAFGMTPSACVGTTVLFKDSTSMLNKDSLSYKWTFGDGGASTQYSPSNIYLNGGTDTVRLTATSKSGCAASLSKIITIGTFPVLSYTAPKNACAGATIAFSDSTALLNKDSLTYKWSFGDGGSSTINSPSHAYLKPGADTVNLTAVSNLGCATSLKKAISIEALPVVVYSIPNASCTGNMVKFDDSTALLNKVALSYKWTMGDGDTSSTYNPTHTYTTAGTDSVSLTATSQLGCTTSLKKTISIQAQPVVAYSIPKTSCAGNIVKFDDSTALWNKVALSYKWAMGDGDTSSTYSPAHTYMTAGTDTVRLTATSQLGCTTSLKKVISIQALPIVAYSIPKTSCEGNIVKFDDSTALLNKGALSYKWEMGDGNTSTIYSPAHAYIKAGTDTVRLTATSQLGCTASLAKNINIDSLPVIAFGAPHEICMGSAVSFNDSTALLNKGNLGYSWSLGEGDFSVQYSPAHTYLKPGIDTVILTATSSQGCSASLKKTVIVDALPALAFAAPVEACAGITVTFNDSSALLNKGTLKYGWVFGDGDSSSQYSPIHSYQNPGNYKIELAAISAIGCTGKLQKSIVINALPATGFIDSANNRVLIFIPADLNLSNYSWDFGDGTNSTLVKPTHTYAKDSSYDVSLNVTNAKGCTATKMLTIKVSGPSSVNPDNVDQAPALNIFPNPSRVDFNISYQVVSTAHITLTIEDPEGRIIEKITDTKMEPGQYVATFKPHEIGLSQGVYFVKLRIGNSEVNKRVVYLR